MRNGADPLNIAIQAAEAPVVEKRTRLQINLPKGRVVAIDIPVDLTDDEFLLLLAELGTGTRRAVRQQASPAAGRLLIPR